MKIFTAFTGLLASALVCLSACAGPSPSNADIAGVWRGAGGAELDVLPDGTFAMKNMPEDYVVGDGPHRLLNGRGRWRLLQPTGQSSLLHGAHWWNVELSISASEGHDGSALTVVHYTVENNRKLLFFWHDEDSGDRFELYPR